ncbi:protein NDH-DEPENDENT CYCLIC ELECTRON FLOW 5 [Iris pallida]|uniref:Protein NDH-DEPENDENT CYCLIC ELECTRON FLOW 5 n=1 Tax=Iris pallida TaxID=29817 RepID=A0AAX6GF48_IRIPA|nr:protein NDH-DEPENDENT CYCLIC ELECTRON FLOW 5 [Iris pallida]
MANAPVSPHLTPLPTSSPPKPGTVPSKQVIFSPKHRTLRRSSSLSPLASSLALPINVDYLRREFGSDGISFEGIGDSCVVKMRMENGSAASMMLPGGLITSYKPLMWHGGTVEVLHTTVSEGPNGEAVVRGGVSMGLSCVGEGGSSSSWSSDKWALLNLRGSAEKYIQLELVSIGPKDMVEVKCLVTLQQDLLGSEIVITNPGSSSLELSGSVITHLTVSTPDAAYAVGLQGSSYRRRQPLVSDFSIVPPDFAEEKTLGSWARKGFDGLFPASWDRRDGNADVDDELAEEGEEDDDCAQMTEKMCRIYTDPPRQLTIMDRGRRNSVVLRRSGFDELYVFSPGSDHEWYGKYAYVCVGPAAMLKPVILGPGGVWTGAQYVYNPNL